MAETKVTRNEITDSYSTSEVDTGKKWTDGRTIYRKTISGVFNVTASNTIPIAHGISGLTTTFVITNLSGGIKLGANGLNGSQFQSLWFRETTGNWIFQTQIDQTYVVFSSSFGWGNSGYSITLEYVK